MERIENKIEKRNDKKNVQKKVLMIAGLALLLGFVGYTGGTTYAKYIDQVEAPSTSATVAKWGHVVNVSDAVLFGTDYTKGGASLATEVNKGAGVAVSAKTSAGNLVAPGTTGSMSFSISGTAEVLSKLTVTATGKDVGLSDGSKTVYPVKWTLVKGSTPVLTDVTLKTVVDTLNGYSQAKINIGATATAAGEYTLSWKWAFETAGDSDLTDLNDYDNDGSNTDKLSNDGVDTIMGWLADGSNTVDTANFSLVDAAVTPAANNSWEFSLELVVEQLAE